MKRLLPFLILFVLSIPSWATQYYVDNCVVVGNDSNNGTAPATPWLTLAKANTGTAASGDTVSLQSGCIWREQFAGSHNIAYNAYGSGLKPSVRGSDTKNVAGNWTNKSGNLWYVSSITHDPGFVMHSDTNQCTGKACAGLIGQRKTAEGSLLAQWDSWYDSGNSREEIFSVGNPTGVSVMLEVPVRSDANADLCHSSTYTNIDMREFYDKIYVQFGCATATSFTNVDFGPTATYHTQFNRNTGTGMTATITGSTFTDWGIISGVEQYGLMVIGGAGPVDITNSTATINHSLNANQLGFVDADINSWIRTVTGNVFYNWGTTAVTAYGIYQAATPATSITVSNNQAYNCGLCVDINGIDDGGATPSVTVSYNYIQNGAVGDVSDHHAIRCYATNGANVPIVYEYNVVNGTADGTNTHAGIAGDGCVGQKFYGNVVVGADDGILLKNSSTGNDIRNNGSAFNRGFGINNSSGSATTFTNNGFYSNTSGNYSSISAGTGDVLGNPFFTNRTGNDLRLSKNSPWIDAGANLGSTYQLGINTMTTFPYTTYNQNSSGAGWDIGAFVFLPGDSWDAKLYPGLTGQQAPKSQVLLVEVPRDRMLGAQSRKSLLHN